MLPSHVHPALSRPQIDAAGSRLRVVAALAVPELETVPDGEYVRLPARDTAEAIRLIDSSSPCLAVVDADKDGMDVLAVCAAAARSPAASVLVIVATPVAAPLVLKAGCDSVLVKPFAPNLMAARLARLARAVRSTDYARLAAANGERGTNRTWSAVSCPKCGHPGAVSFDFSSHRQSWYACLACNEVWLGRRLEE